MSRAIPAVKTWRIVLESGAVYHVLAPTKLLAKLVLRDRASRWDAIRSIGMLRSQRHGIQSTPVVLVNYTGGEPRPWAPR